MQEQIQQSEGNSVSLDGLEQVFEADISLPIESDQATISVTTEECTGLTIREASKHYGLAIPTIRMKIKTGDIPAKKVDGPKGPEWRIFPLGVPMDCDQADINEYAEMAQPDSTTTEGYQQPDRSVFEAWHQANINLTSLIKANQELSSKLESLTYRNGYLEAQAENHKEQIKLLTDSQHKQSSWSRFWSWFTGK